MKTRARQIVRTLAPLTVALGLLGCQEAAPKVEAPKPVVVASFYPLYEFARQVAGDRAEVVSLVPPGVEPHDWEPAPADVARVEKAAVFIYNGAGFDPGAERLAKNLAAAGKPVVDATAGLPLRMVDVRDHGHHAHGHGHKHDHGKAKAAAPEGSAKAEEQDPHVWVDPILAKAQVELIRSALAKADPPNAAGYAERAAGFAARLDALHQSYERGLADCARREIVVSHAAFTYLAHRYKLSQVAVMGLSPEAEPSPAELARVVRTVRKLKAKTIFFETLVSKRVAETIAAEVGATTMVLNPIEGLTPDEAKAGKDYLSLMADNLTNLRAALDCK
ncbi:MAG: zinc ABC transporter substrate-binding protein [Candidatus Rokubacteria bacterium]|nr:zinc ABC transporter substrate-binding protein [Candidatus Rokubacteria bacterium]